MSRYGVQLEKGSYKHVSIPALMKNDGQVMPYRDFASAVSRKPCWRILRGEDMCYLIEVMTEAQNSGNVFAPPQPLTMYMWPTREQLSRAGLGAKSNQDGGPYYEDEDGKWVTSDGLVGLEYDGFPMSDGEVVTLGDFTAYDGQPVGYDHSYIDWVGTLGRERCINKFFDHFGLSFFDSDFFLSQSVCENIIDKYVKVELAPGYPDVGYRIPLHSDLIRAGFHDARALRTHFLDAGSDVVFWTPVDEDYPDDYGYNYVLHSAYGVGGGRDGDFTGYMTSLKQIKIPDSWIPAFFQNLSGYQNLTGGGYSWASYVFGAASSFEQKVEPDGTRTRAREILKVKRAGSGTTITQNTNFFPTNESFYIDFAQSCSGEINKWGNRYGYKSADIVTMDVLVCLPSVLRLDGLEDWDWPNTDYRALYPSGLRFYNDNHQSMNGNQSSSS